MLARKTPLRCKKSITMEAVAKKSHKSGQRWQIGIQNLEILSVMYTQ